jgi:putative transposase
LRRPKARATLKERVLEAFEANRSPRLTEPWNRWFHGHRGPSDGRAKTITTRPNRHARKSVDLVKGNFTVHEVDTLWVSDLTYIGTKEGWLYLVCIMDACSRSILGHAMGETMDTESFINAFNQAKDLRGRVLLGRDHFPFRSRFTRYK